jgi:uncharacterized protein YjbJ (UPF0337 family)
MNRDRIAGAAKTIAGKIKQAIGEAVGDRKTVARGRADVVYGKIQHAVGDIKDTIRCITKKW